jgi:uncharacterized membrane protein
MLPVAIFELPKFLTEALPGLIAPRIFHPVEGLKPNIEILLRWIHFLAGITWIGHLYFFNLVNVNLAKSLDDATRSKVVPQLMPRALWWFRWGAAITVLAGIIYYIIILHSEPNTWPTFFKWLVIVLVTYAIIFALLRPVSGALNNGWILAVIVTILVAAMAIAILALNGGQGVVASTGETRYASNRALSIGIGGGIGTLMFLNVWGIIWPHQKRIIAWTYDKAEKGTAVPTESAKLARRVFLASRMNTWLSIPMLFFMGTASHYSLFGR